MSTEELPTAVTICSDLEITKSIHAGFQCDGKFVCIDFYFHDRDPGGQKYSRHFVLSSDEAAKTGRQIEESGSPGEFPIVAELNTVKAFGRRLREYGENGR